MTLWGYVMRRKYDVWIMTPHDKLRRENFSARRRPLMSFIFLHTAPLPKLRNMSHVYQNEVTPMATIALLYT